MSSTTTSTVSDRIKMERKAERAARKANDPYFGKRRKAGEMKGRTKSGDSRNGCRDRRLWG